MNTPAARYSGSDRSTPITTTGDAARVRVVVPWEHSVHAVEEVCEFVWPCWPVSPVSGYRPVLAVLRLSRMAALRPRRDPTPVRQRPDDLEVSQRATIKGDLQLSVEEAAAIRKDRRDEQRVEVRSRARAGDIPLDEPTRVVLAAPASRPLRGGQPKLRLSPAQDRVRGGSARPDTMRTP